MDAVAYQASFDKEQLALLCANYDRRIDSLGAENKRLKAENDKLRELCADVYAEMITYSSAPNYNASVWTQKLRELGVKID